MVAAPSSVTVTAGQSGIESVSTTVTSGVAQNVALSVSGLPAGASASFSPASISSGQSSTLSVVTSASTPTGTVTLTVTGDGRVGHAHHPAVAHRQPRRDERAGAGPVDRRNRDDDARHRSRRRSPTRRRRGICSSLSASVYTGATNHITSITDSAGNTLDEDRCVQRRQSQLRRRDVVLAQRRIGHIRDRASRVGRDDGARRPGVLRYRADDSARRVGGDEPTPAPRPRPVARLRSAAERVGRRIRHRSRERRSHDRHVGGLHGGAATHEHRDTIASVVTGYKVLGAASTESFTASFGTAMYWAAGIAIFRAAS